MARYQLGLIQFTSGRVPLALVTWEPLFRRPPEQALQRVVHGFAALVHDDFAAAEACFREAIELNRDNEALNRDLRMLLGRIEDQVQAPTKPAADDAAAPAPTEQSQESEEEQGLHVLLSNYQHQGPAH
jgi:Flp pilus assembly protein TadD